MAWARMDDGFHDHPKVGGLSLAAVGLWTLCFTWANRHLGADELPPGSVPRYLPKRFGGTPKLCHELVTAGLWEVTPEGWIFHDFEDYLPAARAPQTASEISSARSAAGQRGAAARWGTKGDSNLPSTENGKLLSDLDGKPMPPSRPVPSDESSDEDSSPNARPDVIDLCEHLADRIEANGSRRPRIGKRWHTAARLLLDVDGRTPGQVRAAIDWCQDDPFWRANILSMPKLRERYDQLRLAAQRQQTPARPGDRQIEHLRDAYEWAQQEDAAHTPPAIGAV